MSLGRNLREQIKTKGLPETVKLFNEARKEGKIPERLISLRDLAEGLLGPQWATKLSQFNHPGRAALLEAQDSVDASAFSNITGQLFVDKVYEGYRLAEFIGDELCETIPVTNGNLSTYKMPWLSEIVDAPKKLQQNEPYPQTSFQEQYIVLPAPEKYGQVVSVNFEMVFSDLTSQVNDRLQGVGRRTRLAKEERQLDTYLGLSTSYPYNYLGTTYNSPYQSTPWNNTQNGQSLAGANWRVINLIEQMAARITDPVTGKPIEIPTSEMKILVMPFRKYDLRMILKATQSRSGNVTSGTADQTLAPNPLDTDYPVLVSKHAYARLKNSGLTDAQAQEYLFLAQWKKAFVYREVYPFKVVQAPPMNQAEFSQDIVTQVKASEYGVPGIREPRVAFQSYNT